MIAVLLAITTAAAYVGVVVIARHRAQSAADLAALAAAARLTDGLQGACAHAEAVAAAMRASVSLCEADALDVVVAVDVSIDLGRFGVGPARAVARAGPAAPGV